VTLVAGRAAFCRWLLQLPGALRAALCADAAVGSLRGAGHGYTSNTSESMPWVAFGARAEVEATRGMVVWGLEAALLAPTRRQTFSVEPYGIASDSSPVGGDIRLRAGVRIW
jgi:hypothetical protein